MTHNEYTHLTAEELCERLNDCFARTQRPGIRVTYAGHGYYHQRSSDMQGWTNKMRRREVEESLRRFHARFVREERERPLREEMERREARSRALHNAADAMLETLKLVAERIDHASGSPRFTSEDHDRLVALIAKAEGREVVS